MTTLTRLDRVIEEALSHGEERIQELLARDDRVAEQIAAELGRMVRALRLAMVADVETALKSRLHLRLETALRRADYLLEEQDVTPPSQRPTWPPPESNADHHLQGSLDEDATPTPPMVRRNSEIVVRGTVASEPRKTSAR